MQKLSKSYAKAKQKLSKSYAKAKQKGAKITGKSTKKTPTNRSTSNKNGAKMEPKKLPRGILLQNLIC